MPACTEREKKHPWMSKQATKAQIQYNKNKNIHPSLLGAAFRAMLLCNHISSSVCSDWLVMSICLLIMKHFTNYCCQISIGMYPNNNNNNLAQTLLKRLPRQQLYSQWHEPEFHLQRFHYWYRETQISSTFTVFTVPISQFQYQMFSYPQLCLYCSPNPNPSTVLTVPLTLTLTTALSLLLP